MTSAAAEVMAAHVASEWGGSFVHSHLPIHSDSSAPTSKDGQSAGTGVAGNLNANASVLTDLRELKSALSGVAALMVRCCCHIELQMKRSAIDL